MWERRAPEDAEPVYTYTILTTGANTFIQRLHERMPVIIPPEERGRWLNPASTSEQLAKMLTPAPDGGLSAHLVSTLVNAPGNDMPECIEPFGAPAAEGGWTG